MRFRPTLYVLCSLLFANASARAQNADEAPPAPVAVAPVVVGFEIAGTLIDPPEKLRDFVQAWLPPQTQFIESGDYDAVGTPIGTLPRVARALDGIGYQAYVEAVPATGGVKLKIDVHPYDRLRQIFVKGNWPVRQDEIIRRLSIRPGMPIPPPGKLREAWMAEEVDRVLTFLKSQGYLDADVHMRLDARPREPSPVNITVTIKLGSDYPIGKIDIDGPQLIPRDEVESLFRHYKWYLLWLDESPFTRAQLRVDVAKLVERYRALGFPAARVLPDFDTELAQASGQKNVPLRLLVEPFKKVDVVFQGNDCCADAELREQLTFFNQGVFDDYEVQESRAAIARFYRQRGNMLVKVNARRERVDADNDRVVFNIEEGPRIYVKRVSFDGNQAISDERLADVVGVKEFPWYGHLGLGGGGYASLQQLENDALRIRDHYTASGFGPTRVEVQVAPNENDFRPLEDLESERDADVWQATDKLFVRFVVTEGPLLTVTKVSFRTSDGKPLPLSQEVLAKSILTRAGEPYVPSRMDSDERSLERLLRDRGYPYGTAVSEVEENGNGRSVEWFLAPGKPATVGPIFIRGNFLTKESTILQWVTARPGDKLTTRSLERGQRNLALLQYFTNASPLAFPGIEAGLHTVPLLIQVQERHDHYGVVRFGLGGATDQKAPDATFPLGFYFSGGYEHGNLLGRGYSLRATGRWGQNLRSISSDFLNPRVAGTMFRLALNASYLARKTERLGDTRVGTATIALLRQLFPGFDSFVRYQIRDSSGTEFLVRGGGADEGQQTARIGALVGAAGIGFDWVQLDNRLAPRQGFKLDGYIELATPALSFDYGENTFVKFQLQSLNVVPLSRRWSLRHTMRYAQGVPLDGSTLLPKTERFSAGGDTTLRGYQFERARTEVREYPLANGLNLVQFFPLGGNLRILSNLDLQAQVSGPFYAGVFLDSGIVEDSLDAVQARRFRHGAGVAPLVVKLPVGDLSVSWAWPLDPGPGDSRLGRLHFNVGLMF
ncbi:MAG: POTRA domain-containing protein [Deltaproteobacteria bacterium]|nr:POTRA domain-containing protein [Deltaproteobacteria bacterium]